MPIRISRRRVPRCRNTPPCPSTGGSIRGRRLLCEDLEPCRLHVPEDFSGCIIVARSPACRMHRVTPHTLESGIRPFRFPACAGHGTSVASVAFHPNGVQIISGASDGQVKLWNIRTSECVLTTEEQTRKIWDMDILCRRGDGKPMMASCSADGTLVVWEDDSSEKKDEEERQTRREMEQGERIARLVRGGQFAAALPLCLKLKQPARLRDILQQHLRHGFRVAAASGGAELSLTMDVLRSFVRDLADDLLETLVHYVLLWNQNAKTACVAGLVLRTVLDVVE
eukprot:Polyplicarium_translucidae@DN3003_c0_g1_i8.p1